MELTVESNSFDETKRLPKPYHVAKKLKMKTLQAIDKWHIAYSNTRLAHAHNFLRSRCGVLEIIIKSIASLINIYFIVG
jgi:UV-stimulated scaffold protein A